MALGKLVASAAEASGSLKKLIKLRLIRNESVSPLTPESYLRVSGLADMCPREEVLAVRLDETRDRKVDADLGLIFAHGTALHWALQNNVLPGTGALIGVWKCVECAKQYGAGWAAGVLDNTSLVPQPASCVCGSREFLYREQHFINEEFRIGGHPDGFLVLPGMPGIGIVECKSISSRGAWDVKYMPNMGHAIQAQCYMWLTGLKWAKILYWDKGGSGATALTEHTVPRDEGAIASVKKTIREVWDGIAANKLPAKICSSVECPRALKCQLAAKCFAIVDSAVP